MSRRLGALDGRGRGEVEEALVASEGELAGVRARLEALQIEFAARVPFLEDEVVRLKGEPVERRRRRMQEELRARTGELERLRGQLAKGEAQPFRGNVLLEMYADEVHTRETLLEICTRAVEAEVAAAGREAAALEAAAKAAATAVEAGPTWSAAEERAAELRPWDDHPSPGTRSLYRAAGSARPGSGGSARKKRAGGGGGRAAGRPGGRTLVAAGHGDAPGDVGVDVRSPLPPRRGVSSPHSDDGRGAPPWTVTPKARAEGNGWQVVRLSLATGALTEGGDGQGTGHGHGMGGSVHASPPPMLSSPPTPSSVSLSRASSLRAPTEVALLTDEEQSAMDGAFSRLQAEIETGRAKIERLQERHRAIEEEEAGQTGGPVSPVSPGKRKQTYYKLLADAEAKVRGLERFCGLYSSLHEMMERQRAALPALRPWRELEGEVERGVAVNRRLKEKLRMAQARERNAHDEVLLLRDEVRMYSRSAGARGPSLETAGQELQNARAEAARLKEEVASLSVALDSSKKLCTSLGRSNAALESEFDLMSADILRLRGESDTLTSTLLKERVAAQELRVKAETNEATSMLRNAQEWLKEAEAGKEEAEARCRALQEELSSSRVERGRVVGERNALEAELGRVRGALELEMARGALPRTGQVEHPEGVAPQSESNAQDPAEALNRQIASLTAELGTSRDACAALETRVKDLEGQLVGAMQAKENFKAARLEKTLLKTQISALRTSIQSIKARASESEAEAAAALATQKAEDAKVAASALAKRDAELASLKAALASEQMKVTSQTVELDKAKVAAADATRIASERSAQAEAAEAKLVEQVEEARKHLAASVAQAKLEATLLGLRVQRKQEEAAASALPDGVPPGPCQLCEAKLEEIERLAGELANAEARYSELVTRT